MRNHKQPKEKEENQSNLPVINDYQERAKRIIEEALIPLYHVETIAENQDDEDIPDVSGKDMLNNKLESIPMLVEPIFHRVGLAALIGSSDTGKSALLRHLAICNVANLPFLGWRINSIHNRSYYISTEDDAISITHLIKKQNIDLGLSADQLEDLIFMFNTEDLPMRLDKKLSEKPADLVIFDTFTDTYDGQLYETNKVRSFLNMYSQIAQRHGCLIIFLHHTNKRSDELAPSKHNALGSQGFEAKMRLMIELKSDNQQKDLKHFCIVKGNYLSHKFKSHSYVLRFTDNLTFENQNQRVHYDLLFQNKERVETIEYEYNEIMKMKSEGLSYQEIGSELGVSQSSVSKKVARYKKIKSLEETNTL